MAPAIQKQLISIDADSVLVEGLLEMPEQLIGVVLFAHGSGSSRFSPRNNYVAAELRKARIGTLLIDLLSAGEDRNYQTRFDIGLLARRLSAAIDWLRQSGSTTSSLALGLFGASTGAAAALQIAAARPADVAAVVSRGGRPDLAGKPALEQVHAPTLLMVGGLDHEVIQMNQAAYAVMRCEKRLEIVPGATHLFEEPGKLETVAALAAGWFAQHLARPFTGSPANA